MLAILIAPEKLYVVDSTTNLLLYAGLDKENSTAVEFLDINGSVSCSTMAAAGFTGSVFWF